MHRKSRSPIEERVPEELRDLMVARLWWAVMMVIPCTALAALGDFLFRPDRVSVLWPVYGGALLACACALWACRVAWGRRWITAVALGFVLVLSLALQQAALGPLRLPVTLALLMGSALLFPWGLGSQVVVSAGTIGSYVLCGAPVLAPPRLSLHAFYETVGLAVGGGVSLVGAAFLAYYRHALARERRAQAHAARQLAEVQRLKDAFLGGLSHALRTPLNALIGYLDLLLEGTFGPLPPEQQGPLERMRHNAHDLLALITDSLDLAALAAGELPVTRERVLLRPLVQECQAWLAAREGRFQTALPAGEELAVEADPVRLTQILHTLIGYAAKFTAGGEIRLAVAREPGGRVALAVSERGEGLPREVLEHLFDPFGQGTKAAPSPGGLDLGLAVAAKLTDVMGGTLDVDNHPGQGTTFTLRLRQAAEGQPVTGRSHRSQR